MSKPNSPPASPENAAISAGILICTYRRPDHLERCLTAIAAQTRRPDDVIVVARCCDMPTHHYLDGRKDDGLPLRRIVVATPGLVAARNAGLAACRTDILAMVDDDTTPHPDWLSRILVHFAADPGVGGVGGRDRNHDGTSFDDGRVSVVGRLQWFGRVIGNHHLGFGPPRDVHLLKGANMSYRAAAFAGLWFDTRLRGRDRGAEPHDDLAFSLAVRRRGWRLVYDPAATVDHYLGPRSGPRHYQHVLPVVDADGFRDHAFNSVVAVWDELSPPRRLIFALWSVLIGMKICPGLLQVLRFAPRLGLIAAWRRFWLAQQGMYAAYRELLRRKVTPTPDSRLRRRHGQWGARNRGTQH